MDNLPDWAVSIIGCPDQTLIQLNQSTNAKKNDANYPACGDFNSSSDKISGRWIGLASMRVPARPFACPPRAAFSDSADHRRLIRSKAACPEAVLPRKRSK